MKIISRKSRLAVVQAEEAVRLLSAARPGIAPPTIELMDTVGDRTLDVSLQKVGDKGVFTRELEERLLSGERDVAIHSLKDLPTTDTPGLVSRFIAPRAPAADVLVLDRAVFPEPKFSAGYSEPSVFRPGFEGPGLTRGQLRSYLEGLVESLGRPVTLGTSSVRRQSQWGAFFPEQIIRFGNIRGNVQTRLKRVRDRPQWGLDATLLAAAGLERIWDELKEFHDLFYFYPLAETDFPPAPGQGALSAQYRSDYPEESWLVDIATPAQEAAAITIERTVLRHLEGGCHLPLGIFARPEAGGEGDRPPAWQVSCFLGPEAKNNFRGRALRLFRNLPLGMDPEQIGRFLYQELAYGADRLLVPTYPERVADLTTGEGGQALSDEKSLCLLPLSRIEPLPVEDSVFERLKAGEAEPESALYLFYSRNAVRAFFQQLGTESQRFLAGASGLRLAFVGPGTAREFGKKGLPAGVEPGQKQWPENWLVGAGGDALGLARELKDRGWLENKGRSADIYVFRGDKGRADSVEYLRQEGAGVRELALYRSAPRPDAEVEKLWKERGVNDWLSQSSGDRGNRYILIANPLAWEAWRAARDRLAPEGATRDWLVVTLGDSTRDVLRERGVAAYGSLESQNLKESVKYLAGIST